MRSAELRRQTGETDIYCWMDLDDREQTCSVATGVGFFDHMLQLLAFHSGFGLIVKADGDLDVDDHHTIEDIGIVLGQLFREVLQDRRGIARYGSFQLPMDETLANVTLDISGRPYLVYNCSLSRDSIGTFSCEMLEEFLRAFAFNAGITLHVNVCYGTNDHHKIEAVFKALGRALKAAVKIEGNSVPSSKGVLE
ncbi:imidazoleglycerol-phosphate dehydratase HisB [Faecalibaculum rodentium]|uniref:imidazoleglycerol-phosphate dehydratase HisB n=1 Tax=Faecalibaculum rodentium TaxID=1702221 RepID=UPI001F57A7B1|nr:imidazoleglycerol-phosphate dehydratase HisB [Faecalibaculum rodentium]